MNQSNSKIKPVLKSVMWAVIILLFYTLAGVLTSILKPDDTNTMLIRGICVWGSVLLAVLYIWRSKYSFSGVGFRKMEPGVFKKFMYFLPAIVMEAIGLVVGFKKISVGFVAAVFFFTLAVGFAEEIYFRGIILKVLDGMGIKTAVVLSSIIFGVTHLGNIAGGANIFETLLQVVFAFIIGIVFAEMFIISKSLIPVIIWHFLHDFTSFLQVAPEVNTVLILLTALQTVILIIYAIFMWRNLKSVNTVEYNSVEL